MDIAIAKPDFAVVGGAEKVLARIARALEDHGHRVTTITVAVRDQVGDAPFGVPVPWQRWGEHPEYFQYMRLLEAFDRLDASAHDLLISTQPPSFAAAHPRHLALFFHHQRVFYDLADVYVESGFVAPELHRRAVDLVRGVDGQRLSRVSRFLANSEVTRERLRRFNGLDGNVGVYRTGLGIEALPADGPPPGTATRSGDPAECGPVLCVGRVAFTKRTELFVHAMKYLPSLRGQVAGTGDRLGFVRALDERLSSGAVDLDSLDAHDLWLNRGDPPLAGGQVAGRDGRNEATTSNVAFLGPVTDSQLASLYRGALAVVAPAFQEDYGMTAVEAMSYGRPLVVCDDGGGLTTPVVDGVNGLVVEPTGRAIAAAIEALRRDPDMAAGMGERGRETAREYTWERGLAEVLAGVDAVAAS